MFTTWLIASKLSTLLYFQFLPILMSPVVISNTSVAEHLFSPHKSYFLSFLLMSFPFLRVISNYEKNPVDCRAMLFCD